MSTTRAVRPTLIPNRGNATGGTAAHYRATCPHCREVAMVWTSDWKRRVVPPHSGARCAHLGEIDAKGRFVFAAPIKRDDDTPGWWRYVRSHSERWTYTYGTRADAEDKEADEHYTTGHVEPVTMPPREWLMEARANALSSAAYYRKHAVWLAAEIAKLD